MCWIFLGLAGILEVVWAFALKYSDGFSRLWPSVITILALVGSFWLLALAMRQLPVGTAYAVWTGIGATGAVIFGMLFLGEPVTLLRVVSLIAVVGGIVGLKFSV